MKRLIVTRVQAQSTGGMRPDASENSQISPSTIVRAARAAGSHPQLASVLLQGRKSANIHASSGVIRGIPAQRRNTMEECDLLVLGSGTGGKILAGTFAQKGERVIVVERKYVAGSCPNIA